MSTDRCARCGSLLVRERPTRTVGIFLDSADERPIVHEPGGQRCRANAWKKEAEARDLVHVAGDALADLLKLTACEVGIVYGPGYHYGADGILSFCKTLAWAPRWAVALSCVGAIGSLGSYGDRLRKAFARAASDPDFAAAVMSTASLAEDFTARRRVLAQLIKSEIPL